MALKFTFLSLNLAKISLFLPKSAQGKKGMKEQPATLLFIGGLFMRCEGVTQETSIVLQYAFCI